MLNFPTKVHWRSRSKLEWIEQELEKFVSAYEAQGIKEISSPKLGCGNGNLEWDDVRPVMEHNLSKVGIPVYIHDHTVDVGLPEHLEPIAQALPAETPADRSFETFMRLIRRMLDLTEGHMALLGSNERFDVQMNEANGLAIATSDALRLFEEMIGAACDSICRTAC